ncbi:Ig-like domain-containing protein [Haloferula sp. BvORR071]|uniref:Ig-like domain-containing protein n=1 Tax=Haloferula sp. BvORR071 TaxID=1396141 RepID=UPI002240F82A|nr:Ig-like domain-containing protein [Haloferula sp. BvORR071]
MKNSNAQALATLVACSLGSTAFGVEHGTLKIVQKNTGNTDTSITISQYLGSTSAVGAIPGDPSGFTFVQAGSSKGDYNMQFTATRANDRVAGVMLTSVSENGRNNGVAPHAGGPAGISYGTSHSEPNAAGFYIPTHATLGSIQGAASELNIDVSAAWFPHAEGWLTGQFKTAATLYSSPAIRLGKEFVNVGDGTSLVDLRNLRSHGVLATAQNGVLLVTGGDNAANFALSHANPDGTFSVSLKSNADLNGTGYINAGVAFAYVPVTAAGMGQVKAVGKVRSDGGTALGGGPFTITKMGTGQWLLKITGVLNEDGTLIISPDGGVAPAGANPVPNNTNNFVSFQWSAADEGWIIQSRNITGLLEDGATNDEAMFNFVFLTPGEEPVFAYENAPLPTLALTSPISGISAKVGQNLTLSAAATVPAGVTVSKVDFYVGGQLVGSKTAAPYDLQWAVDQPGYRLVEAFAYTADNKVAGANRVGIFAEASVAAPTIPGYSMAILDGGDLETDVTELDPDHVPTETTPWTLLLNTPGLKGFTGTGEVRGEPAVKINGAPLAFNSGILFGTNYAGNNYADATTRGAIDNNVIGYSASGNYALKVRDNKQGGGDPVTRPESGRFALGYFPFADGWMGATVATDLSIVGGNSHLPSGIAISKTGTSDFVIEGLPMSGNLLAVSQGENSDNVASIGRSGNQWLVRSVDNNGNAEADSISFLYVPTTAPQVFSGLVVDDGTLTPLNENLAAVGATVVKGPNGYEIQFGDGNAVNPANTALFLSADFNNGAGGDNIYSYYASGNKFVVFSHDLPNISGGFQSGGFRFLAAPIAPIAGAGTEVFVSSQVSMVEEGAANLLFRFARLGGDSSQPLTVNYNIAGSATAGADYQGLTGTVNFPAGVTTVDVQVPTLADEEFELDETVVVTLAAGSGYSPAGGAASATIRNVLFQAAVASTSFQQGANGYLSYFGKRVGSDGTHQIESGVQQYALDGLDVGETSPDINGILRFDNLFGSAPGQIPVGATIVKAELVITTAVADNAQSPGPWVVDRLLFPVDSTTNYIQMTQGSNAGVRGLSSRSPLAGFGNNAQGDVQSADVTQYLRIWAADANPNTANMGFTIYDASTSDGWNFCTSGNDDVNKRPKLVVSYVMPGKQTKSYSYNVDKSVRLVGTEPSFDGSTLEMAFVDQATGATQEGIFHFPVEFGGAVGAIPAEEQIVRAELVINSSSASFVGGSLDARSAGPVAVHRMLTDFTPTSNFGFNGPVVGADIAIAEKTRVAGLGNGTAATFDVTSVVQAWREGNPNYGINVKPETTDGWQFFWPGSTGQYADKKPKLVIYTAKETTGNAFEQWASTNGIGVDPDSDADRDGIPALVEYALGLNPNAFNQLPGLQMTGGNAVLRFLKSSTDPRLSYVIRGSNDLQSWADVVPTVNDANEISLTVPVVGQQKRFFRLLVTYRNN